MRRHDADMIARHSEEVELFSQMGPDRGWLGREVRWNCRPDKVDLAAIKTRLIIFQRPISAVSEMLQSR